MNETLLATQSMMREKYGGLTKTQAWWAVFIFTISLMFNFLDRQIMTLLITPIKADLGLSDTQISLLVGFMFVIFYVGVGIPISRLVDRGPRKWILAAGITFWSLMSAACGLAQNFWHLALARMGLGIGESCNGPATYSMTADIFPRGQLARAISVINIGNVLGTGMALLVGGTVVVWLNGVGNVTVPVLGELRPWQMTFIIVGLPSVLWGLILVLTVPEPVRRGEADGSKPEIPDFVTVLRFLAKWRWVYLPIVLGVGAKSMLSFGVTVWSPSMFERKFDWAVGTPGLYIGIVALIFMPIGLVLGGWLADRRQAQGHDDANLVVVFWASLAVVPFAILYPLMPSPALALSMLAGSLFFGGRGAGPGMAAVQSITPGRMRGTVSAMYIAVFNVIGYGLGPLVIAMFTEWLFRDPLALPGSMTLAAAVLGPLGATFTYLAIKPYVRAVAEARAREG
jgi:MFS family permease